MSGGEGGTGQDARLTAKATHSSTSGLHLHLHLHHHHHHNNCRRNSKPACHNSALPGFTGSACTELSTGSTPYQYNSPLAMQPSFPLDPLSLSLPLLSLLRPKVITFSSHLNHPISSHLISSQAPNHICPPPPLPPLQPKKIPHLRLVHVSLASGTS